MQLAKLYDEELRARMGFRLARGLSVLVTLVTVSLVLWQGSEHPAAFQTSLGDGLVWLSWLVGGIVMLSAARRWEEFRRALDPLAARRGGLGRGQSRARFAALFLRLVSLMTLPALIMALAAVSVSGGIEHVLRRLVLMLTLPVYTLLLAASLCLLMAAALGLTRRTATLWLLTFVIGPHLLREAWPETPSLIDMFGWLAEQSVKLGAGQ